MSGADQDDYADLPGLTPDEVLFALGAAGYAAWSMCLVGNPAPVVSNYHRRVSTPVPGDLVVEISSFSLRMRDGDLPKIRGCIGRLVKHQQETQVVDAEGNALSEDEQFTREVWYIEQVDGGVITWENCSFIAIPSTPQQAREWEGRW
jgi:hypothetical protein